jgi:class 3 adenylate cyclase
VPSLPTGPVTFLFGDVEGSTGLLEQLDVAYEPELAAHRAIVRDAVSETRGEIVDQRGDEVFAAFTTAADAVAAAVEIQRRHTERVIRVRIGLHTGEPTLTGDGYLGLDVHRTARICAAGHGGQILISEQTRALLPERAMTDLGEYLLKGISAPERIYQLLEPGLSASFAPLRAVPAAPRRWRPRLAARHSTEPRTLEQLAWATRSRQPAAAGPERQALSELASALSAAARTSREARRFCAGVDRRALERRRTGYLPMRASSRRAARAAEAVEQQLTLLDSVEALVTAVEQVAHRKPPSARELRVATAALDAALAQARAAIGITSQRSRRTYRRGVRRLGDEYLVITHDETGIEHLHTFVTMGEASAFSRAVRIAEKHPGLPPRSGARDGDVWVQPDFQGPGGQ